MSKYYICRGITFKVITTSDNIEPFIPGTIFRYKGTSIAKQEEFNPNQYLSIRYGIRIFTNPLMINNPELSKNAESVLYFCHDVNANRICSGDWYNGQYEILELVKSDKLSKKSSRLKFLE